MIIRKGRAKLQRIRSVSAVNETIDGEGIVRVDGRVVFVPGMMRGEEGDIRITSEEKRYARGKLESLSVSSPDREKPRCPYYESCGGCSLLHMTREHELFLKKERVRETLSRIGGFQDGTYTLTDTVGGEREGYRNKAELIYQKDSGFGYVGKDGGFAPVSSCRLLPLEMNRILAEPVFKILPNLEGAVIRTNKRGEILLVLRTRDAFSLPDEFLRENRITSLWQLIPADKPVHAMDGKLYHLSGDRSLQEEVCGYVFDISPRAFFQINRNIAEKLYRRAVSLAELDKGDLAIDAYCGVGAIGMTAAQCAGRVFGIELIPEACNDARKSAKNNGIDNISFLSGRCEDLLPKDPQLKKARVVFLDPPRKGCGKNLLAAIGDAEPERVVYISCDPATLARDLAILQSRGYILDFAEPYDMFPGTGHVETVCCLYHQKKDFISVPYEPKNAD